MSRSFFDSIRRYGKGLLKTKSRDTAKGRNRARRSRLEVLESRRLLTYTFSYNPGTQVATAAATGPAAADSLVLEASGGNLLFSVNGGSFDSNWGGNTVPITSSLQVNVSVSTGNGSSVTLGTPTGPASTLGGATFNVIATTNSSDTVIIDDSAGTTLASGASSYSINTSPGTISGPGFNYNEDGSAAFKGGITLDGSSVNGDNYNVLSIFGNEPVSINTGTSTTSTVNVGSGGTLTVGAPLAVFGASTSTTLDINDASDTTNAVATLDNLSGNSSAPFEVKGLSTSPIEYGPGVTALNVFGGDSSGGSAGVTYNVNETQAGTATAINGGTAADTVVANLATGTPLAGGFTFNGGIGGATLKAELAAGATLPASGIAFNGDTAATLNGLSVDGNGQNVTYTADGAPAHKGTIGDGTGTISFTNLTPIDMDGLATATFAASTGDSPAEVINGFDFLHGGTNPAIQVVPSGGGTVFESVAFWNDTTVVVDTSGNATNGGMTVTSANNANNVTNLTITTAKAIAIAGPVAVTGNVTLTANPATIAESGTGAISAALLTTTSTGGTTLNGANNVASFNATNSGAGVGSVVELTDGATGAVTVTGVAQTGGGIVQIVNPNGIAVNGNIAAGTDAVTLTATGGTIAETSPASITGGLLTTTSSGGTTLNDSNAITSFTATNSTSGDIEFAAAGALIVNSAGVVNSASSGNVQIISFGGMQIEGTVSALGAVSLKEYTGEIQESGAGLVSANLLITQSKTGTALAGANTVLNFIAADDPSVSAASVGITLDNTDALDIQQIIQLPTLGGTVPSIVIQNTGGTQITGTILCGSFPSNLGNVQLTEKSLDIQEAGGQIDANQLVTSSVEGTVLNGNNAVTSFSATNSTGGDVDLNNNSNALLTITGIAETNGNVQVINFGGTAVGTGILITGAINDASGVTVSIKEWNADIQESGAGVIDTNTLITQSKRGTLLNGANNVTGLLAVNDPNGGNLQLTDNNPDLYISGITETGGNVTVSNTGAITLPSSASINTSGLVTLDVGTGNATATTSNIAGTISSAGQVTVNGSIGSVILEIPLATVGLNGDGLIFNGGSGSPNVLDISSKAGSNVYCAEEENVSSTVSTIYHAAAAGSPYDAEIQYNNNVQKVEIDDTLGGVDHVAVHVSDLDPAVSTQYWVNAAAGQGSTLKVDASKTTVAQNYAIGDFPAGSTVSTLAPALATASLTWNAAPPAPLTPLPISVQQKFIVNDLALLQYFGGTGGGCIINNTGAINASNATNALMVASLVKTNNNDVTTLVGGQGSSNELLGGSGTAQLIGRGTNDYDLDNYTVDPVTPTLNTVSPPTLKLLPLANAAVVNNFIYEFPTGLSYILQQNLGPLGSANINTGKVIASNSTNSGLTPTEWLSATLESSTQILQQAQGSTTLALLPGCPNETPHA